MYYSEDLVEEVRLKNDIVDVISGYVRLRRQGSRYFGLCPFHSEKSPSFSVSADRQMYYCFGCHAGGNVFTFLMEYENFTFPEAMKHLADRCGMALPEMEYSKEARRQADQKSRLLEIHKKAARFFYYQLKQESGRDAYAYLRSRALSEDTIRRFGLGYSSKYNGQLYSYLKKEGYPDELLKDSGLITMDEKRGAYDKFWNRVMFPIMDGNNRVIGFGGRVMGDGKPKYLNSPETKIFDKSRNLYGLNFARSARKSNMIICEGYMDVIALHQAGFNQAVASLGTALTAQQSLLLKRYTQEVLLTYDSDEAGTKAALRAIPILKEAGLSVRVLNLKPYKDPDEFIKALGTEAFQERIEKAQSSFLFEIEVLERNFNLKDPAGKTAFFDQMARKLLGFSDELERNNYIETLSEQYHISYETLRKKVNTLGITLGGVPPVERPRDVSARKKEKADGSEVSQKLLLTWMISDPVYFREIRRYVEPEDFTVPMYARIAGMLYEQQKEGALNPARIIGAFEDTQEQRQAAGVFNAVLKVETREEMEKALRETIYKVCKNGLEKEAKELDPADMTGLQRVVQRRRQLEKLHISLD
ncbi:MAG: DNA primase [Lachnospiraceae bacterium]|jgi:DNA primase|nr:DNA primase [Lachnospiraceae bacterium]MCI9251409.1 DNA primase [Lachnospiraceae bacterium]MCI9383811.1 DNA primase [Lachnospiraceae bacterium]MCI9479322.1 DNA primase [Lachnospiraceae bacterium]MCI9622383.1 DNA primase [Lachnospiraceae bacterium]